MLQAEEAMVSTLFWYSARGCPGEVVVVQTPVSPGRASSQNEWRGRLLYAMALEDVAKQYIKGYKSYFVQLITMAV